MASEEICISWDAGAGLISVRAWKSLSKAQHILKQQYLASYPDAEERNLIWVMDSERETPYWHLKQLSQRGHFEGRNTGIIIRELEIQPDS